MLTLYELDAKAIVHLFCIVVQKTLKIFQKRLTNFSSRNKSLLLMKLIKKQHLDLTELDFLEKKAAYDIVGQVVKEQKKLTLCAVADSRDGTTNHVSEQLKYIQQTEKFIFEEKGSKDLFIGYPFVEGKFFNDAIVRCPLLFIPVQLEKKDNKWGIKRRKDVAITFNKTFLLAYAYFNGISISEDFLETDFSQFPSDMKGFLTQLYHHIEDSALELNFNQSVFEEKLYPFINYVKADLEKKYEKGQLKLQPQGVLGVFPQADSYLIPDYDFLIEKNLQAIEDVVDVQPIQDKLSEERLFTPYAIDASQENVILKIKKGRSIVVQGPPGSGKSQLICNLIADSIALKKNVLVVSQKKAALNVVYERLAEVGLDRFTALVHDYKHDRAAVFDKIAQQIEDIDNYQQRNNSLDAIVLERSFIQKSREIELLSDKLEKFREALYSHAECGKSIKELYLSCSSERPFVNLKSCFKQFNFEQIDNFRSTLESYISYAQKFDSPKHIWRIRKSFANYSIRDLHEMQEMLEQMPLLRDTFLSNIQRALKLDISITDCEWLLSKEKDILKMLEVLQDDTVYSIFTRTLKHRTSKAQVDEYGYKLLNAFDEDGLEQSLKTADLPFWHQKVAEAEEATSNWISKKKWELFSGDKSELNQLLTKNRLVSNAQGYTTLSRRIENRMNYEHYLTEAKHFIWFDHPPARRELSAVKEWMEQHQRAMEAKELFDKLRVGLKFIELDKLNFEQFYEIIVYVLRQGQMIQEQKTKWSTYFTDQRIGKLLRGEVSVDRLKKTLRDDFEAICAFDTLKDNLQTFEREIIEKVLDHNPSISPEESFELFYNSICLSWLESLEYKYPFLTIASSGEIQKMEKQLQAALEAKAQLCKEIVLINARERTYNYIEYNRLSNMVTYRDLKHQVNKKRMVWPLRKLIKNHLGELLDLMPCWIASPESVSTLFPMEKHFDLVIFDEASQCFAEKGIPAMYRGKQVAILGDRQQLSPYDLYQSRWEEDEEIDSPTLEVVSLLDLGERFLPQEMLKGHYRSQSLDLIDFSNQHFYKGELRFLPYYHHFVKNERGIHFEHVSDGVWESNTNLPEAERVVKLIKELLKKDINNIGVITFNYKQQELILQLLEDERIAIPPDLFVKNIENVQGDERDIIIFSITYAPTKSGQQRTNFGALSMMGGENRLNVAVTRAKQKIYVMSSLLPHQLKVEEAKNEGPRLLKKYLQYAYEVSEGQYKPTLDSSQETPFAQYLKNKISEQGGDLSTIEEDLPFSDLSIKTNRYEGLILTDDNLYFQSLSAKDAHAYIHFMFQQKGWDVTRVYSREFWKSENRFFGLLKEFEKEVCLKNESLTL